MVSDLALVVEPWLRQSYGIFGAGHEIMDRGAIELVRIDAPEGTRWLRLSTCEVLSQDEVEAEAELVASLHALGCRVARPVRRLDGAYVASLTTRSRRVTAVMFEHAPGELVTKPSNEQARAAGELVGRIHVAGADLHTSRRPPIDAQRLALEPIGRLQPWLERTGLSTAPLRTFLAEAVAKLPDTLPAGLCHGDVHLGNFRFEGDSPTIFDFESCGHGPFVYDVASWFRKSIQRSAERREWDAFLAGYESVRTLTAEERESIPIWATLRAIWVMALPAIARERGANWGASWLTDASYFDSHFEEIRRLSALERHAGASR